MLEYTGAGDGARLMMLVLHDDAKREYAYGPAQGLPDTKVGNVTQELFDEAILALARRRIRVSHRHVAPASLGAHHRQRPCIPTFNGRLSSYRTPRAAVDRSSDECLRACPRRYCSEEASALWLGTACRLYGSRTLCRQRYQPPARAVRHRPAGYKHAQSPGRRLRCTS